MQKWTKPLTLDPHRPAPARGLRAWLVEPPYEDCGCFSDGEFDGFPRLFPLKSRLVLLNLTLCLMYLLSPLRMTYQALCLDVGDTE